MAFEKGHQYHPPRNGVRPGVKAGTQRLRVSLAAYLNEQMTEEEIFRWLREVAAGRDPDAEVDADGNQLGLAAEPPDWTTRRAAMAMLLDRRNGRAAQHVHLQQELRAAIGVASLSASAESIAAMPRGDKDQLRELLRRVVKPAVGAGARAALEAAPEPVDDHDVVDAESHEVE